jgi:PPM family protein phosphatase
VTAPRCPHCAEPVADVDRFCEGCGGDLHVRRAGTAGAVGASGTCGGCGQPVTPDDGGYCPGCGLLAADGTDRVERDLGGLAGVSDRGLVHSRNEDAMALGRHVSGRVAAVVCDGVSSSPDPQVASRVAAEATLDVLLGGEDEDALTPRHVREAVAAGARAVAALATGDDGPSCTLVAALVAPAGDRVVIAWVGDSRAYWLTAGPGSRVLTADHSWAAEVVAAGVMDAAGAARDRRAHAITRWLGADGEPVPDLVTFEPGGPGVLLLCSDGLWNYREEAGELASAALPRAVDDPLGAAAALTAIALEAGGRDNITVVAIPLPPPHPVRSSP